MPPPSVRLSRLYYSYPTAFMLLAPMLVLPQPRSAVPKMWVEAGGLGSHDIYGFEEVELPPLPGPSGAQIALLQTELPPAAETDDDETASLMTSDPLE